MKRLRSRRLPEPSVAAYSAGEPTFHLEPALTRLAADPRPSVALYWDFENLHAALVEEQRR